MDDDISFELDHTWRPANAIAAAVGSQACALHCTEETHSSFELSNRFLLVETSVRAVNVPAAIPVLAGGATSDDEHVCTGHIHDLDQEPTKDAELEAIDLFQQINGTSRYPKSALALKVPTSDEADRRQRIRRGRLNSAGKKRLKTQECLLVVRLYPFGDTSGERVRLFVGFDHVAHEPLCAPLRSTSKAIPCQRGKRPERCRSQRRMLSDRDERSCCSNRRILYIVFLLAHLMNVSRVRRKRSPAIRTRTKCSTFGARASSCGWARTPYTTPVAAADSPSSHWEPHQVLEGSAARVAGQRRSRSVVRQATDEPADRDVMPSNAIRVDVVRRATTVTGVRNSRLLGELIDKPER